MIKKAPIKEKTKIRKTQIKRTKSEVVLPSKKIVKKPLVKNSLTKRPLVKKSSVKKPLVKRALVKKSSVSEKLLVVEKKKEGIDLKGAQDLLRLVGRKDFFEIYKSLKEMDSSFFEKGFNGHFENKKDLEDFFKERIFDFINSKYSDLKSQISFLRKKGIDVDYYDFKVLTIPLKLKMLDVEFTLERFNEIKEIILFAEKGLSQFKVEED